MEETYKKVNCFVRVLIVAFCILLVSMILYNYYCVAPKGDISSGIIILLLVLTKYYLGFQLESEGC